MFSCPGFGVDQNAQFIVVLPFYFMIIQKTSKHVCC